MSDRITLTEVPIAAAWNVQGDASRADFADQVARQLSIALPITPNTTARSGALTAFWLAPRSWLVVAESADSPLAHFDQKRDALNKAGGALFDLSASRVAYRLAGCARNRSCSPPVAHLICIHVHSAPAIVRRACSVASTRFCSKSDDAPTFLIMVARSFARDAWQTLRFSAAQYGYPGL